MVLLFVVSEKSVNIIKRPSTLSEHWEAWTSVSKEKTQVLRV